MRPPSLRQPSGLPALLAFAALVLLPARVAADELVSASFRLRGGNLNAGGVAAQGASLSSGTALGQAEATGFGVAAGGLRLAAPGFWPIVAGNFPHLDVDGDLVPSFLDDDDDGDGLLDTVETNTGIFVSPSDTGTDPLNADSDGDGAPDGLEVAAGTDPNDPLSAPVATPTFGAGGRLLLALVLGLAAVLGTQQRPTRRRRHA